MLNDASSGRSTSSWPSIDRVGRSLSDLLGIIQHVGRYVVVGDLRVNGKLQTRRIPCANPAYGFARLEAEG